LEVAIQDIDDLKSHTEQVSLGSSDGINALLCRYELFLRKMRTVMTVWLIFCFAVGCKTLAGCFFGKANQFAISRIQEQLIFNPFEDR
jgi:hypothetical protein